MSGRITRLLTIGFGRLGGDDPRLGHPDVARVSLALLGVGDGGALHRPLHRARAAAGADVQAAQAEAVADLLGVQVFVAADRMAAPAHHQVGVGALEHARVSQQAEHRVGDAAGRGQVLGCRLVAQLDRGPGQVADHREQQLGDAADDPAVDEGHRRRILQVDLHAAVVLLDMDLELRVQLLRGARVVRGGAAGQDRKRAPAQQVVHAPGGGVAQARDLAPGQDVERAHPVGIDAGVDRGQGGSARRSRRFPGLR
jgi:hypothetical protein